MYEGLKVAERRIGETDLEDLVTSSSASKLPAGAREHRGRDRLPRAPPAGLGACTTSCSPAAAGAEHRRLLRPGLPLLRRSTDAFLSDVNLLNLLRQSAPLLIVGSGDDLRHHDRRHRPLGRLDRGARQRAGRDLAPGRRALAARRPADAGARRRRSAPSRAGSSPTRRIPAFIVTLAGLSALRGIALLLTQGYSDPDRLDEPVRRDRARLVLRHSPAGRARPRSSPSRAASPWPRPASAATSPRIGANAEAARRAGIAVRRVTLSAYVLTGLAAALAGIIIAARLGSGSSNAAVGFELDVIAAVVLGGTSLIGGRGTIIGTRPGRAHHRGDRQRPDPLPHLALLHPDRRPARSSWPRSGSTSACSRTARRVRLR